MIAESEIWSLFFFRSRIASFRILGFSPGVAEAKRLRKEGRTEAAFLASPTQEGCISS